MNLNCDCDEECFTFLNLSTGIRTYTCGNIIEEKNEKNCQFRHECVEIENIKFKPPINKLEEEMMFLPQQEKCNVSNLSYLCERFLINHKLSTFQEIEIECKQKNIKPFNHNEETILEFIDRVSKDS